MTNKNWWVYKFGGTSMGSAEKISNVAKIVANSLFSSTKKRIDPRQLAVVVSAMSGVTDALLNLITLAMERSPLLGSKISDLKSKHLQTAEALLSETNYKYFSEKLTADVKAMSDLLDAVALVRECTPRIKDFIGGLGEVWSASILSFHMQTQGYNCTYVDARDVIIVEPDFPSPIIKWEISEKLIQNHKKSSFDFLIITGFVCKTVNDVPTVLGRNGSDYSASIFGYLLDATEIVIWTDVDGVMSADPRRVPDAIVVPELSYREAIELAYFGAKVLHPLTMVPAVKKNIPILIKNSFKPENPGSKITNTSTADKKFSVKGCTTVDNIVLCNLCINGMMTVATASSRLFAALAEHKINIIMSTVGSPGSSVSFAINKSFSQQSLTVFAQTFATELANSEILPLEIIENTSLIAIVGDGMIGNVGLASRFFGALSKASINIQAIAQGAEQRNISVVVDNNSANKALQAAHAGFYLSPQTLSIGILADSDISNKLIIQCEHIYKKLKKQYGMELLLKGICTKKTMQLSNKKITFSDWQQIESQPLLEIDAKKFIDHIIEPGIFNAVVIDCTSELTFAQQYPQWIEQGIHVISANKEANASDYTLYKALQTQMRSFKRHFLFESSVCSSLPIIETLADLIETGDEVYGISGIFYSSLNDAKKNLIILGREMGLELDEKTIQCTSPDKFAETEVKQWAVSINNLSNYTLTPFGESMQKNDFGSVLPNEELIAFYTKRYTKTPLVIRGPSTTSESTASAILADVLRLTRYLGSMG